MRSILLVLCLFSSMSWPQTFQTPMRSLSFNNKVVHDDFLKILAEAGLTIDQLDYKFVGEDSNTIRLICDKDRHTLFISSKPEEKTSTFYKALRGLGFYFPHPLRQISPKLSDLKSHCGRIWEWKPALRYRGFHLHTLHPSEWIAGFFQDRPLIADATIRWLARNQQNIFDLSLLRVPLDEISKKMRPHFELAEGFQIHGGVSLGIALNQQNSYKLLSLWDSYFGWNSDEKIKEELKKLFEALPLSYVVLEAGTSEFTPTDYDKTLRWLKLAGSTIKEHGKAHFTKVHVSTNQKNKKYGNFNFLPQYAPSDVGILPHTVMFYGVVDKIAPMYGNKNFHGIRDFMLQEKNKRPTWYYPETSYWVGMDVDVPLLLTDYLRSRAEDTKFLHDNQIEGQLNFTTGHALGYWLFDWNLALITDLDYKFDPLIGIKLLGEDAATWQKIMDYQANWYKDNQLIAILSSANLQDELSQTHRIHDRHTMKQLSTDPKQLGFEINLLKNGLSDLPDTSLVKDPELKALFDVNILRHRHALSIRKALVGDKDKNISEAAKYREEAKKIIAELSKLPTNYPDTSIFKVWSNPTAYQFGYAYPAASLYFWEREERQIKEDSYFPFWGNMYDVFDIVF